MRHLDAGKNDGIPHQFIEDDLQRGNRTFDLQRPGAGIGGGGEQCEAAAGDTATGFVRQCVLGAPADQGRKLRQQGQRVSYRHGAHDRVAEDAVARQRQLSPDPDTQQWVGIDPGDAGVELQFLRQGEAPARIRQRAGRDPGSGEDPAGRYALPHFQFPQHQPDFMAVEQLPLDHGG